MLTKKLSQPDQDMPLIRGHKAALPQEDFHQLCASTGMLCWFTFC